MSRSYKLANQDIFSRIDEFCAARGVFVANAGSPRWIASKPKHRRFMAASVVREHLSLSSMRKLARIDLDGRTFYCTVGFDGAASFSGSAEIEVDAAHLTVVLAELSPRPRATPLELKNIVEAVDSTSDPTYVGHDPEHIARLFPSIHLFETSEPIDSAPWQTFFGFCVDEAESGESWVERSLADTLRTICDLDPNTIPYRLLCRAIFDGDPANFFLALYRCLEALYAFFSSSKLLKALQLTLAWYDVAEALEDELGWRPREEASLEQLLRMASIIDLRFALMAFGDTDASDSDAEEAIVRRAAHRIYQLRNAVVHYRRVHRRVNLEAVDWNGLCLAMSGILLHVYDRVFAP